MLGIWNIARLVKKSTGKGTKEVAKKNIKQNIIKNIKQIGLLFSMCLFFLFLTNDISLAQDSANNVTLPDCAYRPLVSTCTETGDQNNSSHNNSQINLSNTQAVQGTLFEGDSYYDDIGQGSSGDSYYDDNTQIPTRPISDGYDGYDDNVGGGNFIPDCSSYGSDYSYDDSFGDTGGCRQIVGLNPPLPPLNDEYNRDLINSAGEAGILFAQLYYELYSLLVIEQKSFEAGFMDTYNDYYSNLDLNDLNNNNNNIKNEIVREFEKGKLNGATKSQQITTEVFNSTVSSLVQTELDSHYSNLNNTEYVKSNFLNTFATKVSTNDISAKSISRLDSSLRTINEINYNSEYDTLMNDFQNRLERKLPFKYKLMLDPFYLNTYNNYWQPLRGFNSNRFDYSDPQSLLLNVTGLNAYKIWQNGSVFRSDYYNNHWSDEYNSYYTKSNNGGYQYDRSVLNNNSSYDEWLYNNGIFTEQKLSRSPFSMYGTGYNFDFHRGLISELNELDNDYVIPQGFYSNFKNSFAANFTQELSGLISFSSQRVIKQWSLRQENYSSGNYLNQFIDNRTFEYGADKADEIYLERYKDEAYNFGFNQSIESEVSATINSTDQSALLESYFDTYNLKYQGVYLTGLSNLNVSVLANFKVPFMDIPLVISNGNPGSIKNLGFSEMNNARLSLVSSDANIKVNNDDNADVQLIIPKRSEITLDNQDIILNFSGAFGGTSSGLPMFTSYETKAKKLSVNFNLSIDSSASEITIVDRIKPLEISYSFNDLLRAIVSSEGVNNNDLKEYVISNLLSEFLDESLNQGKFKNTNKNFDLLFNQLARFKATLNVDNLFNFNSFLTDYKSRAVSASKGSFKDGKEVSCDGWNSGLKKACKNAGKESFYIEMLDNLISK